MYSISIKTTTLFWSEVAQVTSIAYFTLSWMSFEWHLVGQNIRTEYTGQSAVSVTFDFSSSMDMPLESCYYIINYEIVYKYQIKKVFGIELFINE